jgi:hypothetical protein
MFQGDALMRFHVAHVPVSYGKAAPGTLPDANALEAMMKFNEPFAAAKEALSGYWIIQVRSKEEALQWPARCPASESHMIEVPQLRELSDFPPDVRDMAAELAEQRDKSQ